jgi:hypothetical protein
MQRPFPALSGERVAERVALHPLISHSLALPFNYQISRHDGPAKTAKTQLSAVRERGNDCGKGAASP